ncbi:MAG: hypothetical protein AB7S38_16120 [Vulcanimicrobiota bacterium]
MQRAIEGRDVDVFRALLEPLTARQLSEMQLYADATLLMYVCERGTKAMVQALLDRDIDPFELPFSDNNEIKACLKNKDQAAEILPLVLDWLPAELVGEMIESPWDPDPEEPGVFKSAWEMAQVHPDPGLAQLLEAKKNAL